VEFDPYLNTHVAAKESAKTERMSCFTDRQYRMKICLGWLSTTHVIWLSNNLCGRLEIATQYKRTEFIVFVLFEMHFYLLQDNTLVFRERAKWCVDGLYIAENIQNN